MEAWTAETTRRTLFHEAAHQLFQEAKARSTAIPPKTHYWATEGLAMLLETFRIDVERNRYIIGDLYDSRIFAAKLYFEEDHFFVPSARLARFGAFDFPKDLKIYAQSAGMAYFLMFAQGGKDRAALLELLQKSYDGSARPNTLSKLLGHSCEELDKEYQAFLQVVPLE